MLSGDSRVQLSDGWPVIKISAWLRLIQTLLTKTISKHLDFVFDENDCDDLDEIV